MSGVSVLIVALVFVLLAVVVCAILTARRLDRLHIRLDRARAALDSAIEHRDAVADIVAHTLSLIHI